jgi:hypothetical protein
VWVAGNATDLAAHVGAAAAAGASSAAQINADLVAEDTERAVAAHRARREAQTAGRLGGRGRRPNARGPQNARDPH